jgi:putative CocE/NonD family hydrolase
VPNLNVAGWWDQEDYYGPLKIYETLEKEDAADHKDYVVIGPWRHGGWGGAGSKLGPIEFAGDQSLYFREHIEAPWFAHFLKDEGELHQPEAMTFETGRNTWENYQAWPPRDGIQMRKLSFAGGDKLSFDPPHDPEGFDAYISDPAHPVPYRHRPINALYGPNSAWPEWLVEDQRFVYQRPDVLGLATEPLQSDLTVTGDVVAHIFASTTGSDSDWIVKLIDAYPENDPKLPGFQLMIANDVFRGRFRNSFEKPERVEPGKVYEYTVDLHSADHVFRTWFPLIDRNPQTFVENIFKAKAADYQPATQKVLHKSYIQLPVQWR